MKMPVLQAEKLRLRVVKSLAQGYPEIKCQTEQEPVL